MTVAGRRIFVAAMVVSSAIGAAAQSPSGSAPSGAVYRPALKPPEFLEPFAPKLEPGHDAFVDEPIAKAIEAQLRRFGDAIAAGPAATGAAAERLLAAGAVGRGTPIALAPPPMSAGGVWEVGRGSGSTDAVHNRAALLKLARELAEGGRLIVSEFQVTAIDRPDATLVSTDVRYDLVWTSPQLWRREENGTWRLRWRQTQSGWQIVEWTAAQQAHSRTRQPLFTEATVAALGGTEAFRRQLSTPLDLWSRSLDAVLTRDSNGHHGVSAGDADGDGLDDLYVAQPNGCLLYTSPSPRDRTRSRMPSSA